MNRYNASPKYLTQSRHGVYYAVFRVPTGLINHWHLTQKSIRRSLNTTTLSVAQKRLPAIQNQVQDMLIALTGLEQRIINIRDYQSGLNNSAIQNNEVARHQFNIELKVFMPFPSILNSLTQQIPEFKHLTPNDNALFGNKTSEQHTLVEIAVKFFQDKKERGTTKKSIDDFRIHIDRFISIQSHLLSNVNVCSFDIAHDSMRAYAEILRKLPKHMSKLSQFNALCDTERWNYLTKHTKLELQEFGLVFLSITTINGNFATVRSFLEFIEDNLHSIESGLDRAIRKLKPVNHDHEKRLPFSNTDITKMFSSVEFTQRAFSKSSYFWCPLIALFTGATQSEILQLHCQDIREDSETSIWYFDINDNTADKRLKNKKGRVRQVPIHQKLIDLGLLKYTQSMNDEGSIRLFPDEHRNTRNQFKNFSAWFNKRFRKKHSIQAIDGKLKDFHSFRHTVSTQLVGNGFDIGLVNDIIGHTSKERNQTKQTYARGLFLKKKNEIIQTLNYPIEFSDYRSQHRY